MSAARTVALVAGLGALAYYLFRDNLSYALSPQTTPGAQPEPQPASSPVATPALSLRDILLAAVRNDVFFADGVDSYDRWAYYYHQITGRQAPDPAIARPGADRAEPITVDQFLYAVQSAGLSGVAQVSGIALRRTWGDL